MMINRIVCLAGLTGVLTACAGIPPLGISGPIAISKIVDEVQCEVLAAANKYPRLRVEKWAASVNLTLQVDDNVGLTPTLSFLDPSASFSFGASGTLKGARQRIYVEALDLDIASLKKRACEHLPDTFDLSGNLGIVEAVDLGLGSLEDGDQAKFDKDKAFGQTIQFVVTKNVSGVGPTWTLTHFTGPGGFFGAERVDTNQLVISFAPGVVVVKTTSSDGARLRQPSVVTVPGGGAARARDLTDQLILRSLPAFRR